MHHLDKKHSVGRWLGFILWFLGLIAGACGVLYYIFAIEAHVSVLSISLIFLAIVVYFAFDKQTYLYHWIWEDDT